MTIALELTEVRWGDLLGFEVVAARGGEPRGERIEVTAVVLDSGWIPLGFFEESLEAPDRCGRRGAALLLYAQFFANARLESRVVDCFFFVWVRKEVES